MPALARAQKRVGKATQVGAWSIPPTPAADDVGSEEQLGAALLALVARARGRGWDAERALRERLRGLEAAIRTAEGAAGD